VCCYIKRHEDIAAAKENQMSSARKTVKTRQPPAELPDDVIANPRRIRTGEHALGWMKLSDNREAVRRVCGGISRQAVLQWQQIPAAHCPALEKAFGIPRAVMRPDIYG
jgi:hypothetical protein